MNEKKKKTIRKILIAFIVILAVPAWGVLFALTHTQIIVGMIQKLSAGTVNTANIYEPLGEPMEGIKDNGQYVITEIKYSENYPNSYLDITYPNTDRDASSPTLIYFHGGGFFGGSKSVGDPLAESDATVLLDDICAEGFNLVNIDYVLVPEYHFPDPLIQANEAFLFLMEHSEEYHLDMDRVVIMGSSAGAIMTSQLGSVITNPDYADILGISPVLKPEQIMAVVLAGIFVIETLSVILQVISFKTTGKRIFKMSPIHHHFELCGFNEKQIVTGFAIFSMLCGIIAVGLFKFL